MSLRPSLALSFLLLGCWATVCAHQTPDSSSKSRHKLEPHAKSYPPAIGDSPTTFRSSEFAFICKIPYAWVDRTQQMQDDASDPARSKLLLAVFERPPEAIGETVNPAIVITAESAASYPGLKTAADYMGPLTELTTSKGFKTVEQPYDFSVGTTHLVRGDFVKDVGKLTMHQSSLVSLRRGFVLCFTFIGGSEDEIDELIEKLSFSLAKPAK